MPWKFDCFLFKSYIFLGKYIYIYYGLISVSLKANNIRVNVRNIKIFDDNLKLMLVII